MHPTEMQEITDYRNKWTNSWGQGARRGEEESGNGSSAQISWRNMKSAGGKYCHSQEGQKKTCIQVWCATHSPELKRRGEEKRRKKEHTEHANCRHRKASQHHSLIRTEGQICFTWPSSFTSLFLLLHLLHSFRCRDHLVKRCKNLGLEHWRHKFKLIPWAWIPWLCSNYTAQRLGKDHCHPATPKTSVCLAVIGECFRKQL